MPLILPGNVGSATAATGFNVANSLRFNSADSAHLDLTDPPGNNYYGQFTFSFWVKRCKLGSEQFIVQSSAGNTTSFGGISFNSSDQLVVQLYDSTDNLALSMITTRVFRDISAWYHIMVAFDLSDGTTADRIKIYVNGTRETSFATSTIPSAGFGSAMFINATDPLYIGRGRNTGGTTVYSDFYLAQFLCVTADSGDTDGLNADAELIPTQVGEFDSDSGIWKPIEIDTAVLGASLDMSDNLGTNGFFLDFTDSSNLGNDVNGGTDWDENNITATDQSTDTCTNNFATVNSLDSFYEASTFSEGNLKIVTEASLYSYNTSTIGLTQGKWYCEVYIETSPHPTTKDSIIGIAGRMSEGNDNFLGQSSDTYGIYGGNGNIYNNGGTTSYGATHTTNDIVGIYMDLDNNKLYFAKNGTIMNSGTGHTILAPNLTTAGAYFMVAADYGNGYQGTYRMNFGSPIYALSSANTDANGFGSFEYNPSSGTFDGASKDFLAICTKNLAEFG